MTFQISVDYIFLGIGKLPYIPKQYIESTGWRLLNGIFHLYSYNCLIYLDSQMSSTIKFEERWSLSLSCKMFLTIGEINLLT